MKKTLLVLFLMMILVWAACDDNSEIGDDANQTPDTTQNPADTTGGGIDTSGVDH